MPASGRSAKLTSLARSATQFADTSAYGKRVNLRLYNLCEALKISRKEGENADSRQSGVRRCLHQNLDFLFRQLETKSENQNNHLRFRKPRFAEQAPDLPRRAASGGKGECDVFYNGEPLKITSQRKNRMQSRRRSANIGFFLKITEFLRSLFAKIREPNK